MTQDERLAKAGQHRPWRLQKWPNDPSVAHLIFSDTAAVPTTDDLRAAIDDSQRRGIGTIRTAAMFPRTAEIAAQLGFVTIDELVLLSLDLAGLPLTRPTHRVRTLRVWHHGTAAKLDQAAFGPRWGLDSRSISDIETATPAAAGRWVRHRGQMAGFAICGIGNDTAYLQRIAVAPNMQRRGIAQALVTDAIRWANRRTANQPPATTMLVNTGIDNAAALALYERFGFRRRRERLIIGELDIEKFQP